MDKEKNKLTIYQELNQFLNLDGFGFQEQSPMSSTSGSGLILPQEKKIIIKGNSPEEIHRKGLELQQKKELQNKFFRTTDRGFQKALQYEAARLPAYIDYEGMEFYPIISSALDLFMEEATGIGINGKMLNIYSNKDRIKYLLDEFFYDIVNVNVILPFWTRNLPVKYDSMIPLLNGETITIEEISKRLKENPTEEIWTYSIQDKTNKIVPSKIIWCDLTRKNSEILKINLDDNNFIETAPDHEFLLRNGTYKRADELKTGDSLMPYYTLTSKEDNSKIVGYEKVYNPSSNHYCYTHRIVSNECLKNLEEDINEKYVTHHIDFNKKNNHPKNLIRMTNTNHSLYHSKLASRILKRADVVEKRMKGIDKYLRSEKRRDRMSKEMKGKYPIYFNEYNISSLHDEHNIIRKNRMTELWSNEEYKNKTKNLMQLSINDECLNIIQNTIISNKNYLGAGKLAFLLKNNNNFLINFNISNNHFNKDLKKSLNSTTLRKLIFRKTNMMYCDFFLQINPNIITETIFKRANNISLSNQTKKENIIINHKVLSIEKISETYDVYCMEVVGKNNEQDRHNFPICGKNENGEYQRNGVFVSNCKYGDNFVLLYGERKKGISHVKQLVNYEMERFERIQNGKPLVKFKERMTGDEYNVFEIAHFRLLGDDKYLPYGSSVLNKIRRVFRQLVMAEDAMLTYRIIRAGEKKVFKIDVGNIDEDDIEEYVYKVATKFKKTGQVAPNDGQIDYRFNIMGNDEDYFLPVRNANTLTGIDTLPGACLALDTKIELLDGRSLELNKIINEFNTGKELWSYSINPKSGLIVPGKVTWAGITRKNTDVLKITLDNGETITCTPDHKFPTKFNGEKQAKDLLVGESMWAFNKQFKQIKNQGNEYEMIYDHSINDWVYTHRMVCDYINEVPDNYVRHHKDFNRFNNMPLNIEPISIKEHLLKHADQSMIGGLAYKAKYENNLSFKNDVDNNLAKGRNIYHSKLINDNNFRNIVIKKQSESAHEYFNNLSLEEKNVRAEISINNSIKSRDKSIKTFNNNPNKEEIIRQRGLLHSKTMSLPENVLKQSEKAKNQWRNSNLSEILKEKQSIKYSHKLLDLLIEYLNEYDRIDMILDNIINIENSEWLNEFNTLNQNNKQLKKLTKITRNNIDKLLKYFGYSNWNDFKKKVPCYNHKIVSIEYLTEKQDTGTITIDGNEELHNYHNFALTCGIFTKNSNLDQIQDIEYLRDNLFTGLGIPKPFLSFQDAAGGGKNMAQYDIRFSKKVNRIQQALIQELNKMAMIHLYLLGYTGDDVKDFTLTLTNPSTQQELLKAELLREKAQTYTELTRAEGGIAAMSHTEAQRLIFNKSDREIVESLKQQKMEMVIKQELQDSPVIIKKSGLFADIDKRYGEPVEGMPIGGMTGNTGQPASAGTPPEAGGQPMGAGAPPAGGNPPAIQGLPNQTPAELPPVEGESVVRRKNVLTEEEYNNKVEALVYGNNNKPNNKNKSLIKENDIINNELNYTAQTMINEIDVLLNGTESINTNGNKKITDFEDINFDDINDLKL